MMNSSPEVVIMADEFCTLKGRHWKSNQIGENWHSGALIISEILYDSFYHPNDWAFCTYRWESMLLLIIKLPYMCHKIWGWRLALMTWKINSMQMGCSLISQYSLLNWFNHMPACKPFTIQKLPQGWEFYKTKQGESLRQWKENAKESNYFTFEKRCRAAEEKIHESQNFRNKGDLLPDFNPGNKFRDKENRKGRIFHETERNYQK